MGVMTFEDFEEEVIENLNFPKIGNKRPKRWINLAYAWICNNNFFEALRTQQVIPTVVGTGSYALNATITGVRAVINNTVDYTGELRRREQIWRFDTSSTDYRGIPKYWQKEGSNLLIRPLPDLVYSLTVWGWIKPTLLSAQSDLTVIPEVWDYAIALLATYFGALSIPTERAGAAAWWQSFGAYTRSINDEHDLVADAESVPSWVPTDESELEGLEI